MAITAIQIRDSGGLAQEANEGSGRKWAELRCAIAMELKGLTEEFNMRNDLMGLTNLLPTYYPFIKLKKKNLKLKMLNYCQLYLNKMGGREEITGKS